MTQFQLKALYELLATQQADLIELNQRFAELSTECSNCYDKIKQMETEIEHLTSKGDA